MRAYLASLASSCRRCRRCSSARARGPVSWMPFAAQVHSLPEGSTPDSRAAAVKRWPHSREGGHGAAAMAVEVETGR